jgi:(p)ppGpp synthase/HD superfamily hydrolase
MTQAERAEVIARLAHSGQLDTVTCAPYVTHCERMAAMVEGDDVKAVAWLHDVLEDTSVTIIQLIDAGVSADVLTAVGIVTRYAPWDYADYINNIARSGNRAAIAVKLADLRDHLHANCPESLQPRYERALEVLTSGATERRDA